jgi:hypothetical protein
MAPSNIASTASTSSNQDHEFYQITDDIYNALFEKAPSSETNEEMAEQLQQSSSVANLRTKERSSWAAESDPWSPGAQSTIVLSMLGAACGVAMSGALIVLVRRRISKNAPPSLEVTPMSLVPGIAAL